MTMEIMEIVSSSYNPEEEHKHIDQFPYPSHVFVPSFVSVKLSGRDVYGVWKTQMLYLLESHGMLGFINGTINIPHISVTRKEKVGTRNFWLRRSDALVKGWIIGSLSEQTLRYIVNPVNPNDGFTAKDVWEKLHTIYGRAPAPVPQLAVKMYEAKLNKEEINKKQEAKERKKEAEEKKKEEGIKRKKVEKERDEAHQSLYEATLSQSIEDIERILKNPKFKVTDKITINGNTALHVAVMGTTKKSEFLEKMLNLAEKVNLKLDMKNSEGSTLLHVASIVGNTEVARILVEKNPELLSAKDNDDQTPVARAFSNMHTETYLYLMKNMPYDIEMGQMASDELLVNAISSKDFDLARELLLKHGLVHSDAVLMAMAQNFPSELNTWETIVNKLIKTCNKTCNVGLLLLGYARKGILWFFMAILRILVWPFKFVHLKGDRNYNVASLLLEDLCEKITSNHSNSVHEYYTNPILEATRQNAHEFVERIVSRFPNAIWSTNEDGHNIIQYAVINRSEKVYNLTYQMSEHKNIYKTIKDSSGNNLLHLAAKLAPTNKLNLISGAALQIQHELQWFQEVERFVCPLNIMQKNSLKETPQMIFTREHKALVIEGEKWMRTIAESYTITAALITTIMFAAAITVPGGNNQDTGNPIFTHKAAFLIFAISDAISLFTSVTSLLMFLSIISSRFAEQDFLFKLPSKLIIGLVALFVSTTAMIIAFGATLFLVFGKINSWILIPIAVLTCLPITCFVTMQLPLVKDLISATYGRSIFGKQNDRPFY